MADNLNTYQTIGSTVSMDALYRGIENMSKSIAAARAAKAKAEAKKNEELQKQVLSKQAETGMTPLWSIKNLDNYSNFITTSTNEIATNPNTGMNKIPTIYAEYQQQAQLTKAQSEIEKNIRTAQQQGYAVSPEVVKAYDKAYEAGGNMEWFTNPDNQLFLARQGIYVTPDRRSEVDVNGKKFYQWGYVSTNLSKAKNLTDELNKATGNTSNYNVTETTGAVKDIPGAKKGQQTIEMFTNYELKPGKKQEIADQYSNDLEIQRFYLVNDDTWGKVEKNYTLLKTNFPNLGQDQLLTAAAKKTIYDDVMAHDFNYKKPSTQVLSGPAQTNITINNAIKDNTVIGAGVDTKYVDSGEDAVKEALWTKPQLDNAVKLLKENSNNPVRYQLPNGKTVIYKYKDLAKKIVIATYANPLDEQSAGLQTQRIRQGSRKEDAITYKPGDFSTQELYDPTTLSKVNPSKVLGISQNWEIEDYLKVGDTIYAKITAQIPGGQGKGVAMKGQNSYYLKLDKNKISKFDKIGAGEYGVKSMYDWKGWNEITTTNNASSININQ